MSVDTIPTSTVGIFDSGVGGLTVANAAVALLPHESLHYFGDTAYVPYGSKTVDWVRGRSLEIVDYLISEGAKVIVIACNTATVAALNHLRQIRPNIPIVGMEPAVKPARQLTKTGVVGVMATAGTLSGERYRELTHRYAYDLQVLEDPGYGLVQLVEAGKFESPETYKLLNRILRPMLLARADTIVLGCTHYPFLIKAIRDIVGPHVNLIDPAPAVARQLSRVLQKNGLLAAENASPNHRYEFSGKAPDWVNYSNVRGQVG